MNIEGLPLDDISRQCAEHTKRFYRNLEQISDYCYELFRRALAEQLTDAFEQLYRIYLPQVRRWALQHTAFEKTGEDVDDVVSVALTEFYFALRGERFYNFPDVRRLLAYLKACVHSAIISRVRKQSLPIDNVVVDPPTLPPYFLWDLVRQVLDNEDLFLLAHCTFVLDMTPAQITREYPSIWEDSRAVTVAKQKMKRRLRTNPRLREYLLGQG